LRRTHQGPGSNVKGKILPEKKCTWPGSIKEPAFTIYGIAEE